MRLFLAIVPPPDVLQLLARLSAGLAAAHPGWRPPRPEGLHLTLRFLGAVDPGRERAMRESWSAAAATTAPLALALGTLGGFPDARRPRVLWIGVEDAAGGTALARLAQRIEEAARRHGCAAESRAFHPHVTLARALRGVRAEPPPASGAAPRASFEVRELTLFESRLGPGGARYTALARFPFRSPETSS